MPRGVPREIQPREWILQRKCVTCGETKAWAHFSPMAYWPDGSVRRVYCYCRACDSRRGAERKRAYRERRREELNAYSIAYKRRVREQLAREATGRDSPLPTAPLRSFLERAYAERAEVDPSYTLARFAEECGVSERMIRRIDREQQRTAMRVVDTICTRLGVPMWEVYPELLEEAA